jgi:acetyl esterase/lipase
MRSMLLAVLAVLASLAPATAQVPAGIAAELKRIGGVVDVPNTAKLYAPMFAEQKEPYPDVTVVRNVSYGPDPLQRFDVFSSGPTAPANKIVVIHVHGGGFERGDKVLGPGSPFYDNIMLWLTRNGMVGVNVNYRLAPKSAWPAAHEDLATVVRWVQQNIRQYGGDPNRIVLWGQSAGASLIAGYLAHAEFHGPGGHGIKGAILHSGFYGPGAGSAYFGRDPAVLARRASIEGLKKAGIPLLVTHTEVDLPEAITEADDLRKALCDARLCPTYVVLKDHSHISQTLSVGTPDLSVSEPVLRFIRTLR